MPALIGQAGQTLKMPADVSIVSVAVTATAAGDAILDVRHFDGADTNPIVRVSTPAKSTAQIVLNNLRAPGGLTVVPDAGVSWYMVEYLPNE